ncbi:MAG TPA: cell surface protein, partial [Methylocystis sp.]
MTKLSQKLIKPKNGSIAFRRALMGGSAVVAMGAVFAPTSASAAVCAGSNVATGLATNAASFACGNDLITNFLTANKGTNFGIGNTVFGNNAGSFGISNSVLSDRSFAFGFGNNILVASPDSTAVGSKNTILGKESTAVGFF